MIHCFPEQEGGTARFDLTDFEWSVIEPLLPTKVRASCGSMTDGCLTDPHTTCVSRGNRWRRAGEKFMVRVVGVEPTLLAERVFETLASTISPHPHGPRRSRALS